MFTPACNVGTRLQLAAPTSCVVAVAGAAAPSTVNVTTVKLDERAPLMTNIGVMAAPAVWIGEASVRFSVELTSEPDIKLVYT